MRCLGGKWLKELRSGILTGEHVAIYYWDEKVGLETDTEDHRNDGIDEDTEDLELDSFD